MKKLLIFCVSLNVALAAGLALVFYLGQNEKRRMESEALMSESEAKKESLDMLEKASVLYAQKNYLDARVRLRMSVYGIYSVKNEANAKIIAMGDWFFFESGESDNENEAAQADFYTFIGAARSLISEVELTREENEIIDKIRISYENSSFSHNVFPSLNSKADVSLDSARKKAMSFLGDKVVISQCENSLFPVCYAFNGKNTFAIISVLGGKLIKMYFYPGESSYDISEEDALKIIDNFFISEQIPDMKLSSVSKEGGVYYASFYNKDYKKAQILIGVKGSGGRVCLFDAENFYKYYKNRTD